MTSAQTGSTRSDRVSKREAQYQTGRQLKQLYPELDGWQTSFVATLWTAWQRAVGMSITAPGKRDERFPRFLVERIQEIMVEKEQWR